ncbi:MAG: U32 family peptidase [Proteobacteria bacterium]|nr:MAG: U32 family peptidase [Pseudomonadota bacterium]
MSMKITLGPVLFNWPPEIWRDFYFRIADETDVDSVCVGEVVCAKRAPFFEPFLPDVIARLQAAGKEVALSTLALISNAREEAAIAELAKTDDFLIEANDIGATDALAGRRHALGPLVNVYNEATLGFLAARGAARVCLPPELPAAAVAALAAARAAEIEVLAFGRLPLAISARCFHARAEHLHKDGCQFVCNKDADGRVVRTLGNEAFLAINGTQTLSHSAILLLSELDDLAAKGIARIRLSPHTCDMATVADVFRAVMDHRLGAAEATRRLRAIAPDLPFSNGFYHGRAGRQQVARANSTSS